MTGTPCAPRMFREREGFVMRRSKTVKRLILSYVVVLVLPLLVMMPFYYVSLNSLEGEINRSNDILLNMVKLGTDVYVRDIGNMLLDLAADDSLQRLIEHKGADETARQELSARLKAVKDENFYVDEAYILFGEWDMVIFTGGGGAAIRSFYDNTLGGLPDDYYTFRKQLGSRYRSATYTQLRSGDNSGTLSVVLSVPFSDIESIKAQIVIDINMDRVIGSVRQADGFNIYVLDENRVPVYVDNGADMEGLAQLLPSVRGNGVYKAGNTRAYVSSIEAGFGGLTYYIATPYEEFRRPLTALQWIIAVLVILCLLCAVPLIRFVAGREYSKVKRLMTLFEKGQAQGDEYEYLYHQVEEVLAEKEKLRDELSDQQPILADMYLRNVLKGRETPNSKLPHTLLDFEKAHMVLVANIENYQNIYFNANHGLTELEKYQEALVITTNIMEEALSEQHKVFLVEIDDSVAAILEATEIVNAQADAAMQRTRETVEKYFGFSLRYGYVPAEAGKMAQAYREAGRMLENAMVMEGNAGGPYQEENAGELYYYPLTSELKVIGLMKNREFEQAKQELSDIIDTNTVKRNPSPLMMRLLMSNMLNTMLKLVAELQPEERKRLEPAILELSEEQPADAFRERLFRLVDAYAAQTEPDEGVNVAFRERVESYIQTHYNDMGLSVQRVADYLGVNPSYLSRKFKEQFQTGILDYIYQMRIQKSKRYLSEGRTVEDAANQVGFATARAFSRAFVKYEGISPGQYKKAVT